jgi:hypothetical protein
MILSITELFEKIEKKHYKKSGRFLARSVQPGEITITKVGGCIETIKFAEPTDWLIMNINVGSSGESWAIGYEKFITRYKIAESNRHPVYNGHTWDEVEAVGEVMAGESPVGITFIAPWGEEMMCKPGDYLASPIGGEASDVYRIERKTFLDTYKEVI